MGSEDILKMGFVRYLRGFLGNRRFTISFQLLCPQSVIGSHGNHTLVLVSANVESRNQRFVDENR